MTYTALPSCSKKICCIVNPQAARKKWERKKSLKKYIQENLPCELVDSHQSKEHTIELSKRLCSDQDIIVAVGGDGTIADVIQGIIDARKGKEVLLGILPLGSGNAFRKSFKIPKNLKRALSIIKNEKTREIDLIKVEGKTAGFASIGATAEVTQKRYDHKIPGFFGHLYAGRILRSIPRKNVELELFDGMDENRENFDKKILRISIFDCVVAKTSYFGYGWKMAPMAEVDDGYLDITIFETSGKKYLSLFPLVFFGLYQKTQKHFKAREIIVRGKELYVQYNGEMLGLRDEVRMQVLPRALKIISP